MLKRLFSSLPNNKLNCSDCRLYYKITKLCKINKLNAIDNRIDDTICGIDAKKFWSLDKTNLIKSEKYSRYSGFVALYGFLSIPGFLLLDYRILFSSILSFFISEMYSDESLKYEKKYLDDNNINDDINHK